MEAARDASTPAAQQTPLRALRIQGKQCKRGGLPAVTPPPRSTPRTGKKPTPPVGPGSPRPTLRQPATGHASAAASPHGAGKRTGAPTHVPSRSPPPLEGQHPAGQPNAGRASAAATPHGPGERAGTPAPAPPKRPTPHPSPRPGRAKGRSPLRDSRHGIKHTQGQANDKRNNPNHQSPNRGQEHPKKRTRGRPLPPLHRGQSENQRPLPKPQRGQLAVDRTKGGRTEKTSHRAKHKGKVAPPTPSRGRAPRPPLAAAREKQPPDQGDRHHTCRQVPAIRDKQRAQVRARAHPKEIRSATGASNRTEKNTWAREATGPASNHPPAHSQAARTPPQQRASRPKNSP